MAMNLLRSWMVSEMMGPGRLDSPPVGYREPLRRGATGGARDVGTYLGSDPGMVMKTSSPVEGSRWVTLRACEV